MSDLEKRDSTSKQKVTEVFQNVSSYIVEIFEFRGAVYFCLEMCLQFQYPGPVFQSRELSRVGSVSEFIRVFPITETVNRVSLGSIKYDHH